MKRPRCLFNSQLELRDFYVNPRSAPPRPAPSSPSLSILRPSKMNQCQIKSQKNTFTCLGFQIVKPVKHLRDSSRCGVGLADRFLGEVSLPGIRLLVIPDGPTMALCARGPVTSTCLFLCGRRSLNAPRFPRRLRSERCV